MKVVNKQFEYDAEQFNIEDDDIMSTMQVKTDDGLIEVHKGDWVIKDSGGNVEVYTNEDFIALFDIKPVVNTRDINQPKPRESGMSTKSVYG